MDGSGVAMSIDLAAYRFTADGALLEKLPSPAQIGIRVNVPTAFGVDRIEVTVPTRSDMETLERTINHLGNRILLTDGIVVVSGFVTQVQRVSQRQVRLVSPWPNW